MSTMKDFESLSYSERLLTYCGFAVLGASPQIED